MTIFHLPDTTWCLPLFSTALALPDRSNWLSAQGLLEAKTLTNVSRCQRCTTAAITLWPWWRIIITISNRSKATPVEISTTGYVNPRQQTLEKGYIAAVATVCRRWNLVVSSANRNSAYVIIGRFCRSTNDTLQGQRLPIQRSNRVLLRSVRRPKLGRRLTK